jgi:hypothetical protein
LKHKRIIAAAAGVLAALALVGCSSQADTVSQNLSTQADNFTIYRDIVLHDDFTNQPVEEIEGLCSLGNDDTLPERTVTCKIGSDSFVKEILDMGNNESLTAIQTQPVASDPYAYKIIFKPTTIDFDLQTPNHNAGGN